MMETTDAGSRGEDECKQLRERLHTFMGSMRHFVGGDDGSTVNLIILKHISK